MMKGFTPESQSDLPDYPPTVRKFDTGATRDSDTSKPDYEGFLSPLVMEAFGVYMNFNRQLADGSRRDSDNWQKGMPDAVYMKSGFRHFIDWWREHRGIPTAEGIVWALLGLLFNAQGYLHEYLKRNPTALRRALDRNETARRERWGKRPEGTAADMAANIMKNNPLIEKL